MFSHCPFADVDYFYKLDCKGNKFYSKPCKAKQKVASKNKKL